MQISDVNELCDLFGAGEYEVTDISAEVAPWCFEAKGTLEDGSTYQFRVSEGVFTAMSLYSKGSGLFQRLSTIVPDWLREHGITVLTANASLENRTMFLTKLPEELIGEFSHNPDQDIALRDSAL